MKAYTIDLGAAWAATIETFQDGNVFRETNIDLMADSIADRLGYLKAQSDTFVAVGDNPVTWTGEHIFDGFPATFNDGIVSLGPDDFQAVTVNAGISCGAKVILTGGLAMGIIHRQVL